MFVCLINLESAFISPQFPYYRGVQLNTTKSRPDFRFSPFHGQSTLKSAKARVLSTLIHASAVCERDPKVSVRNRRLSRSLLFVMSYLEGVMLEKRRLHC